MDISTSLSNVLGSTGGNLITSLKDTSLSDAVSQATNAISNASISDLSQLGDLTVGQAAAATKTVATTLSTTTPPAIPKKVTPTVVGGISLGLIGAIAAIYFLSKGK